MERHTHASYSCKSLGWDLPHTARQSLHTLVSEADLCKRVWKGTLCHATFNRKPWAPCVQLSSILFFLKFAYPCQTRLPGSMGNTILTMGCTFVQKYWWIARQIRVVVGCTMDEIGSYLCMSVKALVRVCKGCGQCP